MESKSKTKNFQVLSGNHAAARIAYELSEAAAIYPITPSSDMAELCDAFAASGQVNIFGTVPKVIELQSEAGAAGTLHGLLAGGALATSFTASQGLLLKIPNMYKIVGELLPCVIHVSARAVATHALSIFGDHSDVMSVRSCGWAMLASGSVQEAQDMALVAHLATLEGSYPILHFFDGFRTSHEFNKISVVTQSEIKKLVQELNLKTKIKKFRESAMCPTKPHQRGTAQNPDTFFQNREACTPYVVAMPDIVHNMMCAVGNLTGRHYKLFDYYGDPKAANITIAMGSGVETIEEYLNSNTQNNGLVKVRLYRPFDTKALLKAIPSSCKTITVLDRTKENGAVGDPLFTDVVTALAQAGRADIKVIAGRYGLSSKEFTPAMVHAIYVNMQSQKPKNHFTVGINDDVSGSSLDFSTPAPVKSVGSKLHECIFYGLGSDGTVSANKNSASIIGDNTNLSTQVYFVYDSKKSGGTTVSHLRFSDAPIKSTYLITHPTFVAIHNQSFLQKFDMLKNIKDGGTVLLNTTYTRDELNQILPNKFKQTIKSKNINLYIINAYKIASELGLGSRINTIMQSAFFKLTEVVPYNKAKELMKSAIIKSYGKKGQKIIDINNAAVDRAADALEKITVSVDEELSQDMTSQSDNKYYNEFCAVVNRMQGDTLPVSAFNPDGRVPTATSQYEKRNIATALPQWLPEHCIQCNHCVYVCPHATIRPHLLTEAEVKKAPKSFTTLKANGFEGKNYRIQLNPEDCTGCASCANVCPTKEKALVMKDFTEVQEIDNYNYSLRLPDIKIEPSNVKNSQFLKPYFEFSGACAGCGETPYIKLASQLFGDRMVIANATGCTSIYCGSSPTCPFAKDKKGNGPTWANSLFEDNAEFGYGLKLAKDIIGDKSSSVWIIGGDGWAYDIGYGGLDHVIAQNEDVNILVLDTELYSNTGGQSSKATPAGAIAKFASGGKPTHKKDLGAMAMNYPNVYIAQIAIGANYAQTLTAFKEAEAHKGPSIIIAYSTCINHGIDMSQGMKVMKNAVDCGYWILYRRKPATDTTAPELILDSKEPTGNFKEFLTSETRYKALLKSNPAEAERLFAMAEKQARRVWEHYVKLAQKD